MLELNSKLFFAEGDDRKCYVHPEDDKLCIKILHDNIDYKVQKREVAYYNLLKKKKISWDMLSKYYGEIDTNFGRGVVFEFIRDYDGDVSKTLDFYFSKEDKLSIELAYKLEKLKNYLYEEGIVFRDLITQNIVVKKESNYKYKLVVIDGIGHNDFFPFVNYGKYFARRKIVRQWNRKRAKWFDKYKSIKGIITDV